MVRKLIPFPLLLLLSSSLSLLNCLMHHSKLVDDIVYEVDAKMVTIKEGDVDIGT